MVGAVIEGVKAGVNGYKAKNVRKENNAETVWNREENARVRLSDKTGLYKETNELEWMILQVEELENWLATTFEEINDIIVALTANERNLFLGDFMNALKKFEDDFKAQGLDNLVGWRSCCPKKEKECAIKLGTRLNEKIKQLAQVITRHNQLFAEQAEKMLKHETKMRKMRNKMKSYLKDHYKFALKIDGLEGAVNELREGWASASASAAPDDFKPLGGADTTGTLEVLEFNEEGEQPSPVADPTLDNEIKALLEILNKEEKNELLVI